MATFTVTLTNTVSIFGPSDAEMWNEIVWGTDNWGFDNDSELVVGKFISGSVATVSGTLNFKVTKIIESTATVGSVYANITLKDSAGYTYIYPSDASNLINISSSVFTIVSGQSVSFSTFTVTGTSWSTV